MTVTEGRTWLQMISTDECWELITSQLVGRVAILVDGVPEIYPINHGVHLRTVVFRTDPGSKLRGMLNSPTVCFEVDGFDKSRHVGWSVMVKGRAVPLDTVAAQRCVAGLPIDPWAQGDKAHWIRIEPVEVTGRRIRPNVHGGPNLDPDSRGYR